MKEISEFEKIINAGIRTSKTITSKSLLAKELGISGSLLSKYIKVKRSVDSKYLDEISTLLLIDKIKLYNAYTKAAIVNNKRIETKIIKNIVIGRTNPIIGASIAGVIGGILISPITKQHQSYKMNFENLIEIIENYIENHTLSSEEKKRIINLIIDV